jgi:hypothetical protein
MEWHVQYRSAGVEHVIMQSSPELAVETACRLLDAGKDVFAIGTGSLEDSIDRQQIGRIYAMWIRTYRPLGR